VKEHNLVDTPCGNLAGLRTETSQMKIAHRAGSEATKLKMNESCFSIWNAHLLAAYGCGRYFWRYVAWAKSRHLSSKPQQNAMTKGQP
jgi:hypothetical protein